MKTIVHVNQHHVRSNATKGTDLPVLTVKTYKENKMLKTKIKEVAKAKLQRMRIEN